MKKYIISGYVILALSLNAVLVYGIYSIIVGTTEPARYGLTAVQMSIGFAFIALIAWLPLLLWQLKKHHPGSTTLEDTFARAEKEFLDLANTTQNKTRCPDQDE